MFLVNKYQKYYYTLCRKAQTREEVEGYTERHHIIPRSLGGSNEKSNIAILTAREHYIAHMLLVRITEGVYKQRMINALFRMACQREDKHFGFVNSRKFAAARLLFASVAGWAVKGKTYEELYGSKKAQELKLQRAIDKSRERKGKTWEDIFGIEKAAQLRVIRGRQAKEWNTGRTCTDATRKLISEAAKNRTYNKLQCVCGKSVSSHNIKKHQSACKIFGKREDS